MNEQANLNRALALWGPEQAATEALFQKDNRPKVLALCDSWGAYPPEWLAWGPPSNIVAWLRHWRRWNISAITENGGELCAFLVGERKLKLCELLDKVKFDLFFLSGGGNDFLGKWDMAGMVQPRTALRAESLSLVTDHEPGGATHFLTPMFYRLLPRMRSSILDLLDWIARSKMNGGLRVVHHAYDFVWPSDQGASFLGGNFKFQGGQSWIKPYLDALGWTDPLEQRKIIRVMLLLFKEMLLGVAGERPSYNVVLDTQGTAAPDEWEDEIHLTSKGFNKIARKIEAKMIELVPRAAEGQADATSEAYAAYVAEKGGGAVAALNALAEGLVSQRTMTSDDKMAQHLAESAARTNCPRCGYNGHIEGGYRPGARCPRCNFKEKPVSAKQQWAKEANQLAADLTRQTEKWRELQTREAFQDGLREKGLCDAPCPYTKGLWCAARSGHPGPHLWSRQFTPSWGAISEAVYDPGMERDLTAETIVRVKDGPPAPDTATLLSRQQAVLDWLLEAEVECYRDGDSRYADYTKTLRVGVQAILEGREP